MTSTNLNIGELVNQLTGSSSGSLPAKPVSRIVTGLPFPITALSLCFETKPVEGGRPGYVLKATLEPMKDAAFRTGYVPLQIPEEGAYAQHFGVVRLVPIPGLSMAWFELSFPGQHPYSKLKVHDVVQNGQGITLFQSHALQSWYDAAWKRLATPSEVHEAASEAIGFFAKALEATVNGLTAPYNCVKVAGNA